MPQLDVLTFCLQLSLVFAIFWTGFLISKHLLLSQYLGSFTLKALLWKRISLFIILMKFSSLLSFLHFLMEGTKISTFFLLMIYKIKFLKNLVVNNFLKILFYKSLKKRVLLNVYFYKNLLISLKKEHLYNKYNFLLIGKFIYVFGEKYKDESYFLNVKRKRLIFEENLKLRFDDDEVIINNLLSFSKKRNTLKSLFKN